MTDESIGPAVGSLVPFLRPGAEQAEEATIATRFDNGDIPMATLNFTDGSVVTVAVSEIQG